MPYRISLLILPLTLAVATAAGAQAPSNVRVTARVVVVDREAASRAGVSYVTLADGRVQVTPAAQSRGSLAVRGPLGIRAFLDLARQRRWTRSESMQMTMVLSGSEARISSQEGSFSAFGGRTHGPSLTVLPTVRPDGRIRLQVSTGVEDRRDTPWGSYDASPGWAETEVIGRSGEEIVVASSAVAESSTRSGVLRIAREDRARDVLIVLTPEIVD